MGLSHSLAPRMGCACRTDEWEASSVGDVEHLMPQITRTEIAVAFISGTGNRTGSMSAMSRYQICQSILKKIIDLAVPRLDISTIGHRELSMHAGMIHCVTVCREHYKGVNSRLISIILYSIESDHDSREISEEEEPCTCDESYECAGDVVRSHIHHPAFVRYAPRLYEPIHATALQGSVCATRALLDHGANVNAVSFNAFPLLDQASDDKKCFFSRDASTPLDIAVMTKNWRMYNFIRKMGGVSASKDDVACLHARYTAFNERLWAEERANCPMCNSIANDQEYLFYNRINIDKQWLLRRYGVFYIDSVINEERHMIVSQYRSSVASYGIDNMLIDRISLIQIKFPLFDKSNIFLEIQERAKSAVDIGHIGSTRVIRTPKSRGDLQNPNTWAIVTKMTPFFTVPTRSMLMVAFFSGIHRKLGKHSPMQLLCRMTGFLRRAFDMAVPPLDISPASRKYFFDGLASNQVPLENSSPFGNSKVVCDCRGRVENVSNFAHTKDCEREIAVLIHEYHKVDTVAYFFTSKKCEIFEKIVHAATSNPLAVRFSEATQEPIHIAVFFGLYAIVKVLLDNGANVNAATFCSPERCCLSSTRHDKTVDFHGPHTPLDFAFLSGDFVMIDLLRLYGGVLSTERDASRLFPSFVAWATEEYNREMMEKCCKSNHSFV